MSLTAMQALFVQEYLVDLNGKQAAIRAGASAKSAEVTASKWLRLGKVKAELAKAQKERASRTEISADMVLQQWWKIATADPNEIVSHRRVCCRHCHGNGHAYQWKASEYQAAMEKADADTAGSCKDPVYPSDKGGYGFDATREPHPGCPECHGEGMGEVHVADTRRIKGAAKALYAGAKQSANGIEVKLRDQDKALELVAKHLGMFKDEISLGGNVVIEVIDCKQKG